MLQRSVRVFRPAITVALILITGAMEGKAVAGELNGLTEFTPKTPAKASEVNGNFAAVKTAVNGNAADIADLQAQIAALQDTVSALQSAKKGPTAYAVVELRYDPVTTNYDPILLTTRSYNISSVRRSGYTPGSYCLTPSAGIDPSALPVMASPDYGLTVGLAGEQLHAYADTERRDCNANEFEVVTNTATGAGRSIISFTMVVP